MFLRNMLCSALVGRLLTKLLTSASIPVLLLEFGCPASKSSLQEHCKYRERQVDEDAACHKGARCGDWFEGCLQ